MYSPRKKLATPNDYGFPYNPPYDIQQQLMESLYSVLEKKQIGIFESPTGTGKSLTLTCGALRWLMDHEALVRKDLQLRIDELGCEIQQLTESSKIAHDWIQAQYETTQKKEQLNEIQQLQVLLRAHETRLQEMRERAMSQKSSSVQHRKNELCDNYEERASTVGYELHIDDLAPDSEILDADTVGEDKPKEEQETWKDVKIYYCSRTHSQLAQVLREVKRTIYGKQIRCISLASRQQLCINPQVRRLPGVSLINERCLDMARNAKSTIIQAKVFNCDSNGCAQKKARLESSTTIKGVKCPYKASAAVQNLSENALIHNLDIEDLVASGERIKACPYYASRAAIDDAQLIMLPYQMLLHHKTRIQSGIDLHNAVVIIDEAHNLLDTITQIYSAEISLDQLEVTQQQIIAYKMRYSTRFNSANLLKINQLNFIIKRLIKLLTPSAAVKDKQENNIRMLRTHELMSDGEFYNIDIFKILEFCERTRFAQKLQGFAKRINEEPKPNENQQPSVQAETGALGMLKRLQQQHMERSFKRNTKQTEKEVAQEHQQLQQEVNQKKYSPLSISSPIRLVLAFLETLTDCAENGRILLTIDDGNDVRRSSMKYLLLNAGEHFQEILREARSIIISGGTMQPTAELTDQLFKSCTERVIQKFYDHVVPPEAVLPFVVSKGPTGKHFCFNYLQRNNTEMLFELGMTIQNLCNVIPAGVVCFFPSYDFIETVYKYFQENGFIENISKKKHVFREPRLLAANGQTVDQMLAEYATVIKRQEKNGALLLSVVGGKLSEGLNFADDLGRCVIVVGMPYPNRHSPEIKERMKYLNTTLNDGAGNEYYENLCMKAVNQCIGRSVRHIKDYACVMLLDERYANQRVQRKLPQWITRNLKMPTSFGPIQGLTAQFFKAKKADIQKENCVEKRIS